jgi:hypothetical protein
MTRVTLQPSQADPGRAAGELRASERGQGLDSTPLRSGNATARPHISRVGHIPGRRIDRNRRCPDHLECGHAWPDADIRLGSVDVAVRHHSERRGRVEFYSSPDATPPTITIAQLVTQGKVASAVVHGSAKISASVSGSEIGPRPALTRKGGQRCPMFRVRGYAVAGDSRSSCSRAARF